MEEQPIKRILPACLRSWSVSMAPSCSNTALAGLKWTLQDVQVVGLQAPEALVAGVHDGLTAVIVQPGQWHTEARALVRCEPAHIQRAATLGRQEELSSAVGDAPADVRFGLAVVNGNVNVIDARIQNRLQDALRLPGHERPAHTSDHAAQLQRAEAEGGHLQSGTAEGSPG